MAARTFSCSCYNEQFSVQLPEDVTRADSSKCQDIDTTHHNLEHKIRCQDCEHSNTIYYCNETHAILADDWVSVLFDLPIGQNI